VLAGSGDAEVTAVKPYRYMGGGREPVWERVARTGGARGAGAVGGSIGRSGTDGAAGDGWGTGAGGGRLL
jgi:hypothetical protein